MTEQPDKKINRRELLVRATKASLSIAAAGTASYLLYDKKGPEIKVQNRTLVTLPDYSVQQQPGKTISIVKGRNRVETVRTAIESLGGIQRFVKPGETVVIKPNIAFASPAMIGATTSPQLIAEVVRLCLVDAKAKKVIVTDNPINDPASCFMISGIEKAATEAGAKIVFPKSNFFKHTTLKDGKLIKNWPILFEPFAKADKLIGITPVKNHLRSIASMSIKNWYGLLGGQRNIFHQDINTIIAELAMMVKPTLVILDGTETMITNGPTGGSVSDLKRTNTMIVSCDMVAADSFGCSLLGLKPSDLPYLQKAQLAGAGITDYESLKPILATTG